MRNEDFYFWFPYGVLLLGLAMMIFINQVEGSVLVFFSVGYLFGRSQRQETAKVIK